MLRGAQCPEPRGTLEKLPKSCVECNSGPEAPGMHAGKPRWSDWTISGPARLRHVRSRTLAVSEAACDNASVQDNAIKWLVIRAGFGAVQQQTLLCNLTPELSRAAKRLRLERIVRTQCHELEDATL